MEKRITLILGLLLFVSGTLLADQGMTSATHSQNVGKIVFSSQEVKFRNEDISQLKAVFTLKDPIYSRVYFARSLRNSLWVLAGKPYDFKGAGPETHYEIRMYVNGNHRKHNNLEFLHHQPIGDDAAKNWTTFQANFNPTDRKMGQADLMEAWAKTTRSLSNGTHRIRFELWGVQGQVRTASAMATGEFDLVVGNGDSVAGDTFPASTYTGYDLGRIQSDMKKALVGPVAKNADDILKVSVTGDWKEGRYTDSLAKYRKIQGTVLWKDTDGDGFGRFTSYSFIQTKSGNGWTKLKFNRFVNGGPEGEVDLR